MFAVISYNSNRKPEFLAVKILYLIQVPSSRCIQHCYSSSEKRDRSTSDSPGGDIDSAGDCVGIASFGSCPLLNFEWGLSRYQFISGWSPYIYL